MILKLSKKKKLSFYRKTDIFIGEKDFDKIQVLIPSEVDENDTSELTFKLHLVNERGEYAIRTLTVEQEGIKVVGSTSITADLTSVAQDFSVYIEMVKGNDTIIGKTNVLEVRVNPLPDEQGEIIPEDIERQRVIVSSTNPPSEAHKKYLLNAFWVNYADKTQFVLTSIDELQAPEKYAYTWKRNNNHVVVSTETAPEYTPDNVDYKYSNGDMWVQTDLDSDKILSISICTGYTKELIDNETWRYNYTWAILNSGITNYNELNNKPQINNITLQGNKSSDDLNLQDKLTAGENITIENNVISAEGGGSQIVSGVVNANGTITFTDSDGNAFTTSGSSVIGADGIGIADVHIDGGGDLIIEYTTGHMENVGHVVGADGQDYVLTAQDKSDIADIVLGELPTTEGVLYGN